MPEVHAKQFGPSGAVKWLNCPGSALLEANLPDTTSTYAAEGTLAHSLGELKLRKKFEVMSQSTYTRRLNKLKKDPLYQTEMDGYTDEYVEYITEIAIGFDKTPFVAIEKQVSFEAYAPGGFGTSDCIVIGGNTMYVIDLKYGKGKPVSAEQNPQGMLYALGALNAYALFYPVETVVIAIVQPRLNNISEYQISREELEQWGMEVVKPAAEKILNQADEYHPGEWCDKGFCKARDRCRARCNQQTALEDFKFALPPMLTNEEVGDILKRAQSLKSWVSQLEDYALKAVLDGKPIPGWKAVEGRRSRRFTDLDRAFDTLRENGIDDALLYERNPLTLAKVEKLLGKKTFDELVGGMVITDLGKPTLVTETDRREPYNTGAAKDFENLGGMN